jgi:hypothetical protein
MCFEFDYFVSTDGGAASNGTADSLGYGSYYEVQCNSRKECRSSVTQEKALSTKEASSYWRKFRATQREIVLRVPTSHFPSHRT